MNTYVCTICGYIYEEAAGIPADGIAPGTTWDQLPADWVCPLCKASKDQFRKKETEQKIAVSSVKLDESALGDLSVMQLAALCSNLARGCEKQYLTEEMELFKKLADYFTAHIPAEERDSLETVQEKVDQDLSKEFPEAFAVSRANGDRGAQRALTWSEKVSKILSSLLARYLREGEAFLENTNVYVCEVCGFIYVGDNPPELCPVCKVPAWKLKKIERR